jgi:putative hemolysin
MPGGLAEVVGLGLSIGAITYVSLVIGELVPKQLALRSPERVACLVAPPMTILARVAAPIVWLLSNSGRLVLALFGQSGARQESVTDAEIHSLIAEAEAAGVIEPEERSMISGVMRLGDRPVRSVMVPRTDVIMLDIASPAAEIGSRIAESGHSRFVVYKGKPDNILGVIQTKDISAALLRKRKLNFARLVRKAPFILDTMDALDVVARLKEAEVHFGLVCDEYGHFEGIVTSADILEAIVGAFKADEQGVEPAFVERDDGSLLVAGWASSDLMAERLVIPLPPKHTFHTAAGFALHLFGRLPSTGEAVEHAGYRFEVVDLDGRRIDKLLVTRLPASTRRAARP